MCAFAGLWLGEAAAVQLTDGMVQILAQHVEHIAVHSVHQWLFIGDGGLGTYSHVWPTVEDRTRTAAGAVMNEAIGIPADPARTSLG